MTKRGLLISFEGVDATGTLHHLKNILIHLKQLNIPCSAIIFPWRTSVIGNFISQYASDIHFDVNMVSANLLCAAHKYEYSIQIKQMLKAGVTVFVHRYLADIVCAFSCQPKLDQDFILNLQHGLPKPDFVFFINTKDEPRQRYFSDPSLHSMVFLSSQDEMSNQHISFIETFFLEYIKLFLRFHIHYNSLNPLNTQEFNFDKMISFIIDLIEIYSCGEHPLEIL